MFVCREIDFFVVIFHTEMVENFWNGRILCWTQDHVDIISLSSLTTSEIHCAVHGRTETSRKLSQKQWQQYVNNNKRNDNQPHIDNTNNIYLCSVLIIQMHTHTAYTSISRVCSFFFCLIDGPFLLLLFIHVTCLFNVIHQKYTVKHAKKSTEYKQKKNSFKLSQSTECISISIEGPKFYFL